MYSGFGGLPFLQVEFIVFILIYETVLLWNTRLLIVTAAKKQ